MYEIIDYSSINPLITGSCFLVLGGIFSFIGSAVSSAVNVAKKYVGIGGKATVTETKSSTDASALAKKKLQLAKAKAKLKVAKAKGKTAVSEAKAKMFKTILMVGGGVVLLIMVFVMAKGGRK